MRSVDHDLFETWVLKERLERTCTEHAAGDVVSNVIDSPITIGPHEPKPVRGVFRLGASKFADSTCCSSVLWI
jgi:hypothetical protein